MAKFLFCLPRYHTNATPWMGVLLNAGHQVSIDVMLLGPTENHELVQPAKQEIGALSRRLQRTGIAKTDELHSFPDIRGYWRHMRAVDPDVVIVRGVTRWFCRMAALFAILQHRKLVIYDQEDAMPRPATGTWFRRALFRLLRIPHFTSRAGDRSGHGSNLGQATSIAFGCPFRKADVARWSARAAAWPPRLLMVAKYRDRKGHANLLEALALIADTIPFSMTFCGEEASDTDIRFRASLQDLSAKLGIADRVAFIANVPHRDIGRVYAEHDLFILPSRNEPAAVSPIEAAWAGCAVLISRDSGTRGYFPDENRYAFDAESPADIARALGENLANPATLAEAREQCRDKLRRISNADVIRRQFEAMI